MVFSDIDAFEGLSNSSKIAKYREYFRPTEVSGKMVYWEAFSFSHFMLVYERSERCRLYLRFFHIIQAQTNKEWLVKEDQNELFSLNTLPNTTA